MTTLFNNIARSAVFLLLAVLLTAGTASSQTVTTTIGDFQGRPLGQVVSVPVTISDLVSPADDFNSFQFTVNDVPGVVDYVGVTAGPALAGWNIQPVGNNVTAANVPPLASQTFKANQVLLYLQFQLNGEGVGNVGLSSLLYNANPNVAVGGNYLVALREILADAAPSPFSSNDYRLGDMVDVPVSLSGMLGPDQLAALQFKLRYNPAIIDVDVIAPFGFADITVNNPNYNVVGIDDGAGTITVTANQLNTGFWAGNGPLFTINGQAVGQGTSAFTIDSITASDPLANPIILANPPGSLVVGPANVAPIANGDGISVDEDDSVSDNATWTDPDNSIGELTFALVTDVTNGTLVFNADGSYTYTPDADYNGGDSFTYTVNDSRATSAPGTVTITVNPINDQVVAVDVDGGSTDEDVATTVDVKVGVSDVEDLPAAMSYTADAVSVNGGTVVNNGDGTFTYTPFANFNGTDTFDYTVTDNGDGASPATSATATVTIVVDPVNDQVVALDVDAGSTDEDTAATIDVKGAVSDVEDLPAAMSYSGDAVSANGGTVVNNADGTFTYTPAANFHGTDSFDYTVTDNGDGADPATSATATVTIEVNAVNDPVQASDVDGGSLDEDSGSIVVDVKGSVFDITDLPADMSYTADAVSANGGTVVNNGDGTFTYTPAADFNGTDTFDYTVTDNGDGSDVTTTSATATVTVTVDPVNDQVVAVDVDGGSTDEDVATTVDVKVGVSDVEDLPGAMSYTADAVSANGGTVVNNGNGTFTYTPFADWYGTDTFTYTVTDNGDGADVATTSASAVVTIEVLSVNDAPVANDDVYSVDEGEQILVLAPGLLGNDTDISGDGLVANLVTGPAHGTVTVNSDGSFVYTHDGSETNSDSFTYTATDDGVGSLVSNVATVHLTVNAQNDPPVAVDDSGYEVDEDGTLVVGSAAGVRANDSDAEVSNAGLTVSLVTGPTFGSLSLNPDGSFTYVHGGDEFATSDSFVYELSDGALTDQATATIVIHLFNDAPVVDGVADDSITEAETFVVGVIATDAEGATLTYSLAVDPATANASIDSATGVVTFSPSAWNPIELGTYDFVVTVSDGIDETSIAFSITVTRSQAVCDVDNNGLCQAFDATLVLMHRVGLLLGPAPFNPLTDSQLLAADMNFDESVDAFDASLILRAVVSPKDETPIGTPNGVIAFGSIEQVDGGYLVPVVLSGNSSNLRSVEFVLTFDPTVMSVQGIQEKLGEAGWLVVHNADNVAGTLHVVSAGAVDAVDGDLFSILVSTENSDALKSMQAQTAMNAEGLAAMSAVDVVDVPESYSLSQNYPNPFNPTTTIQYQLPENVAVTVGVYDMQGRLIRMLVQQDQPAGTYSVQWDGRSSTGNQVASGVYVYQIRTGAFVATRRMILVK